jgi:hypothetical protein
MGQQRVRSGFRKADQTLCTNTDPFERNEFELAGAVF